MSLTYSELVTAVKEYVQTDETTFNNNIDTFIRQAEQRIYNAVQLPASRQSTTSALTPNSPYLSTPNGFLAPLEMFVIDADGAYHNVLFKDVGWMRESFPDPTDPTGIPDFYALFNEDTFILARTPDDDYSVNINYFAYPTSLVDVTADTYTWLSENFDSVLLYGCIVEAYIFLKGEPDLLATYDTKYKEALQLLKTLSDGKDRIDTSRVLQTRVQVP